MSRIAIVVHAVYPGDPRIRRQSDALIGAGHEVDLFCLRGPGEAAEEDSGGLRILRLPVNRAFTGFAGHVAEYLAFAGLAAVWLAGQHRIDAIGSSRSPPCRTSWPSPRFRFGSTACRCCLTCTRTCPSSSGTDSPTRCCGR